jgi:hypothetical protein
MKNDEENAVKQGRNPSVTMDAPAPAFSDAALAEGKPMQSWGDRHKHGAYHFVRDWVVNYFINFIGAASITYAFDTSKKGERFNSWIDEKAVQAGKLGPKVHLQEERARGLAKWGIKYFTKTQMLLMGGHILLPALKWMRDHERRLEFRLGHLLDLAQEFFGKGNAASKRNIEEYHRVSELVAIGKYNRKQRDPIAVTLSDQDRAMLAKNLVNEDLCFEERPTTWLKVVKARLWGMLG